MTDILYRKLAAWPQKDTAERKSRNTFSAGYQDTLTLLEDELDKIDAVKVILEGFIPTASLRRDGWPKADVNVLHPGMRLSWQSRLVGTGELMTDEYPIYAANLRAIALTLTALRAVGRYGTMNRKQQYTGLVAVTAAAPSAEGFTSVQAAAKWLAQNVDGWDAGMILDNSLVAKSAYNAASIKLHPDTGGSHDQFVRLQQAKTLLDKHHKERR